MTRTPPDRTTTTAAALARAAARLCDDGACEMLLRRALWPRGPTCPRCGGRDVADAPPPRLPRCRRCRRRFSPRLGTVLEDSPVSARGWLLAAWAAAQAPASRPSDAALAEAAGVTRRTAWRMRHRLAAVLAARPAWPAATARPGTPESAASRVLAAVAAARRTGRPAAPEAAPPLSRRTRGAPRAPAPSAS